MHFERGFVSLRNKVNLWLSHSPETTSMHQFHSHSLKELISLHRESFYWLRRDLLVRLSSLFQQNSDFAIEQTVW